MSDEQSNPNTDPAIKNGFVGDEFDSITEGAACSVIDPDCESCS